MEIIIGLLVGLVGGGVATFFFQQTALKNKSQKIVKDAQLEAENIKKERILQAKEKYLKLKEECNQMKIV
jgi:ribonuclease Y